MKKRKVGKNIKDEVMTWFFPVKCPMCDQTTGQKKIGCCSKCQKQLPYTKNPRCMKCGKSIGDEEKEYCTDCASKKHVFQRGIALWSYQKDVKNALYRFKYKNRREYGIYFAEEIIKKYYYQMKEWNADGIVPVPLHKKRFRKRGYNQAELIANVLGRYLCLPVYADLVSRIKNTKPQKELNHKERQKNLKNAFKINRNSVKLKRVVVVGDIYTTGATVDAVAVQLLKAGVERVYVVTLCIGKGY